MSWPTCDPAQWGAPDNEVTRVEGPLTVSIHFTWDGVSTPPCDGDLLYVDVQNASEVIDGWVWFYGRNRKSWRSVEIPAGTGFPTPLRITRQQLRARGFELRSDTDVVILSLSDQPPDVTG